MLRQLGRNSRVSFQTDAGSRSTLRPSALPELSCFGLTREYRNAQLPSSTPGIGLWEREHLLPNVERVKALSARRRLRYNVRSQK
jgi:hypothetical protein